MDKQRQRTGSNGSPPDTKGLRLRPLRRQTSIRVNGPTLSSQIDDRRKSLVPLSRRDLRKRRSWEKVKAESHFRYTTDGYAQPHNTLLTGSCESLGAVDPTSSIHDEVLSFRAHSPASGEAEQSSESCAEEGASLPELLLPWASYSEGDRSRQDSGTCIPDTEEKISSTLRAEHKVSDSSQVPQAVALPALANGLEAPACTLCSINTALLCWSDMRKSVCRLRTWMDKYYAIGENWHQIKPFIIAVNEFNFLVLQYRTSGLAPVGPEAENTEIDTAYQSAAADGREKETEQCHGAPGEQVADMESSLVRILHMAIDMLARVLKGLSPMGRSYGVVLYAWTYKAAHILPPLVAELKKQAAKLQELLTSVGIEVEIEFEPFDYEMTASDANPVDKRRCRWSPRINVPSRTREWWNRLRAKAQQPAILGLSSGPAMPDLEYWLLKQRFRSVPIGASGIVTTIDTSQRPQDWSIDVKHADLKEAEACSEAVELDEEARGSVRSAITAYERFRTKISSSSNSNGVIMLCHKVGTRIKRYEDVLLRGIPEETTVGFPQGTLGLE
ncbi:hypothetical protein JX266_012901 [Neoarthrinium moseri]|nr:hypothetical protein JX266_012901 [Neoarthrinium moseri]